MKLIFINFDIKLYKITTFLVNCQTLNVNPNFLTHNLPNVISQGKFFNL